MGAPGAAAAAGGALRLVDARGAVVGRLATFLSTVLQVRPLPRNPRDRPADPRGPAPGG